MTPAAEQFNGKKITLMGLGLLGRGVGDAKFFAAAGADLIVTDLKSETELAPSVGQLKTFSNITYHLGGHRLEDFENRDLVIRAPNAPLDSPFLARARERGIPVEMDASLFVKLCAERSRNSPDRPPTATIVGVTGTRGKSTVAHLIYEMARAARAAAGEPGNVYIGGNERDTATLSLLEKIREGDIVILELDSWQLQGFEEDRISPHISVWTNFMPDHMNYYRGDMDRYFRDKAAIARFQKEGDYVIAPRNIKERIESRFGALQGSCIVDPAVPDGWEIAIPGEHNRANAAFAIAAARCLGVPEDDIKKVLKTFSGLPNRLEFLGEKNGIAFYNDSNATTPEATIAALQALTKKNRQIVLIAGGSDKELDFADLAQKIVAAKIKTGRAVKKLILFEGKATEKLKAFLPKDFPIDSVSNMNDAVQAALAAAGGGERGSIILLSPAATSFGIFKNEYDRGDQFKELIQKMKLTS